MATATASTLRAEWRAMGTRARVALVDGDAAALAMARDLVDDLEARWSRFRSDSEVSRVNAAGGRPVVVSPETASLVADAVAWWQVTAGRFDPTVLPAVLAAGYDRSFELGTGPGGPSAPAPGCHDVRVEASTGVVSLPAGVRLDLGGIGKGRAVDLVADTLAPHAAGVIVDLGGDVRVWGAAPAGGAWRVAIEDLRTGSHLAVVALSSGAVATSSVLRRRWGEGPSARHHLIDPTTGRPAQGPLVSATVAAGRAEGAEVLAKAAVVSSTVADASGLLADQGVAAWLVPAAGPVVTVGPTGDLEEAG